MLVLLLLCLLLCILLLLKLSFDFYPGFDCHRVNAIRISIFWNYQLFVSLCVCDWALITCVCAGALIARSKSENKRHSWCLCFNKLLNFGHLNAINTIFFCGISCRQTFCDKSRRRLNFLLFFLQRDFHVEGHLLPNFSSDFMSSFAISSKFRTGKDSWTPEKSWGD